MDSNDNKNVKGKENNDKTNDGEWKLVSKSRPGKLKTEEIVDHQEDHLNQLRLIDPTMYQALQEWASKRPSPKPLDPNVEPYHFGNSQTVNSPASHRLPPTPTTKNASKSRTSARGKKSTVRTGGNNAKGKNKPRSPKHNKRKQQQRRGTPKQPPRQQPTKPPPTPASSGDLSPNKPTFVPLFPDPVSSLAALRDHENRVPVQLPTNPPTMREYRPSIDKDYLRDASYDTGTFDYCFGAPVPNFEAEEEKHGYRLVREPNLEHPLVKVAVARRDQRIKQLSEAQTDPSVMEPFPYPPYVHQYFYDEYGIKDPTLVPFLLQVHRIVGKGLPRLRAPPMPEEPILIDNKTRFALFPIQNEPLWHLYKKAQASIWTAEEVDLKNDLRDFLSLPKSAQHTVEYILAFFATADGIVSENLAQNFAHEVTIPEARYFYSLQMAIENVHAETYALLLDTLVPDKDKKHRLTHALFDVESIRDKANWALQWCQSDLPFAVRLIAFAIVEGVFFSGAFCIIYWIKH